MKSNWLDLEDMSQEVCWYARQLDEEILKRRKILEEYKKSLYYNRDQKAKSYFSNAGLYPYFSNNEITRDTLGADTVKSDDGHNEITRYTRYGNRIEIYIVEYK